MRLVKIGPGGSDPPQEPHILLPLSPIVDGTKIDFNLDLCKQKSKKVVKILRSHADMVRNDR